MTIQSAPYYLMSLLFSKLSSLDLICSDEQTISLPAGKIHGFKQLALRLRLSIPNRLG